MWCMHNELQTFIKSLAGNCADLGMQLGVTIAGPLYDMKRVAFQFRPDKSDGTTATVPADY